MIIAKACSKRGKRSPMWVIHHPQSSEDRFIFLQIFVTYNTKIQNNKWAEEARA